MKECNIVTGIFVHAIQRCADEFAATDNGDFAVL